MDSSRLDATQALSRLIEGNQRFSSGNAQHPLQDIGRRLELAEAQAPYAIILGCADSRVPPELLFDAGLGELFTVRSAGQALDSAVLGSLEFGVANLGVPLLVVLGHENCGAVAASAQVLAGGDAPGGYLDSLVAQLTVSVQHARVQGKSTMLEYVDENVTHITGRLVQESTVLRDAVAAGALDVVGLTYKLTEGVVRQIL